MRIPDVLRIGKDEYRVQKKRVVDWGDSKVDGNINYRMKTMKIRKNMDERLMEDTFFHEVAHGILKEMEYNHPKATALRMDENFVQELGLNLRKVFLDLLEKQKEKGKN